MSRYHTIGTNPENGEQVKVVYGFDQVPPFKAGYFFQVYSDNPNDIYEDLSGEGLIVNEGFVVGLSKNRLLELFKQYSVNPNNIEL